MRRSVCLLVGSAALLSATIASAQAPQPTGMWSPMNPALLTNDGVPDANDLPAMIALGGMAGPGGLLITFAPQCMDTLFVEGAASVPVMPFDGFGRGGGPEVMIDQFDMFDPVHPRPIRASFDEGGGGVNVGTATMIDSDGDHRYERIMVQGNKGPMMVTANLDLKSFDRNRDGFPEFVTLFDPLPANPMFNLGVFQFFGFACGPATYDQVWIPVARDLAGDAAIIGDLDGNGIADPEFFWGPKLQIVLFEVPTLGGLGLAALAMLLLLVGLRLVGRHGFSGGV